jgi:hypothetical protein
LDFVPEMRTSTQYRVPSTQQKQVPLFGQNGRVRLKKALNAKGAKE